MGSPSGLTARDFLALVSGTRGHFLLESGYHTNLWLDIETLFARRARIAPWVTQLAAALRPYRLTAVCGAMVGGAFLAQLLAAALEIEFWFAQQVCADPDETTSLFTTRYRVPPAFARGLPGARVAVVDDAMSAGSAMRGAYQALQDCGANPVVVAAVCVLGSIGEDFFAARGLPVIAVVRQPLQMWMPADCPLCASGVPLRDPLRPADDTQ